MKPKLITIVLSLVLTGIIAAPGTANAQDKKPNIVVIWGDDIGMWNVGISSDGTGERANRAVLVGDSL